MKYDIIICDPPWDYAGQTQHGGKGHSDSGSALKHYPTMKLQEMIDTIHPIDVAANDCLLFMWATWPHLDQAIKLGEGWGFKYVHTPFVWVKDKVNPGFYTMTSTEIVLCFKRGKIPTPRGTRNERQVVNAPRTRHSEKPREIQDRISRMFPTQKKLEMFAREPYNGWDCWGNEVDSEVSL
jgi:N6-adenosine-specific RNA methylase IME4